VIYQSNCQLLRIQELFLKFFYLYPFDFFAKMNGMVKFGLKNGIFFRTDSPKIIKFGIHIKLYVKNKKFLKKKNIRTYSKSLIYYLFKNISFEGRSTL
jgi:hypothetical protein